MKEFIQSQPLYQQAYETIKESILKGEISSGSKIVVTKLAEQYKVSRTPLREALRQLTNEGLLVQTSTGTRVVALDHNDYEELLYCRLTLEKEIFRLLIPTITVQELREAENFLEKAESALKKSDYIQTLEYNAKFHKIFIQACPNKRLMQLIENVRSLLLLYRANILKYQDYNFNIIIEHRDILEALKERDEVKVVEKVDFHIQKDKQRGARIFEIMSKDLKEESN